MNNALSTLMRHDAGALSFDAYCQCLIAGEGSAMLHELPAGARWPTEPASSSLLVFNGGFQMCGSICPSKKQGTGRTR